MDGPGYAGLNESGRGSGSVIDARGAGPRPSRSTDPITVPLPLPGSFSVYDSTSRFPFATSRTHIW